MTLNAQGKPDDPRGGIEWTHIFGPRSGYTWNPVGGCLHGCEWVMPDSSRVECYAKDTAERSRSLTFFPDGFQSHYWHSNRLEEPLAAKDRRGIFLDSMADLMGHWVPAEQIRKVLNTVERASWHIFFILTKNAPRLLEFRHELPPNLFVGVSMPPDHMMGKPLETDQKIRMISRSLDVLAELPGDLVKWMSFEPLSWDVARVLPSELPIQWAVIGAASRSREHYQPSVSAVESLLERLDRQSIPIHMKGNLHWNPWRAEFPSVLDPDGPAVNQLSFF